MRVHTILAAALAFSTGAHSQNIEPRLPERWDTNSAEDTLLDGFKHEAGRIPVRPVRFASTPAPERIPGTFSPWWLRGQASTIGNSNRARPVTLEDLYVRAIKNSTQIRVFSDLPLIRETGIREAKGAFDTNAFVAGQFGRRNEPVGSTLTTGGASRFKQDEWEFEAGVRKKVISGAEVVLSQKLFRTDNNSTFFVPNPQSRATLELSVVQPLLKGAGVGYNRSIIEIAKIDSEVAMAEFMRQSESHMLEIARTYWALYAARVTYLQRLRLLDETAKLADEVKAREKIDAQGAQIFRAQSAVAERKADLIRAEAAIRNAQDRLKALTSDPELIADASVELIPRDRLVLDGEPVDARAAAHTALRTRPEINQAFMQLRAATIRENMSRNELLPELNLVLNGSLNGLDNGEYGGAWSNEYNAGAPGWGIGFVFSFPLENNIARARHERRQLETRQQINQVKTTVDTVLLEVKVSAREVATSYREALAKYAAVLAYKEDIATLTARRSIQPFNAQASQVTDYIDRMLDAQDRRAIAEEDFIRSAANYQVSLVNLQRAKGKLLHYENVNVVRDRDGHLPLLHLQKGTGDGKGSRDSKKLLTTE
jgi:outer membrane protein TolC